MKKTIYGLLAIALLLVGSVFVSGLVEVVRDGNAITELEAAAGGLVEAFKMETPKLVAEMDKKYSEENLFPRGALLVQAWKNEVTKEGYNGGIGLAHAARVIVADEKLFGRDVTALGCPSGPLFDAVQNLKSAEGSLGKEFE